MRFGFRLALKVGIVALENEKAKFIKDNNDLIEKIDSNDKCLLTTKRKLSDLESTIEEVYLFQLG
jgi:hypothetical protein